MMPQIVRRQFIFTVGGTAVAWPLSLHAQQGKRIPRIGILLFGTPDTDPNLPAFLRGLQELGYVEVQNIARVSLCRGQAGPAAWTCGRASRYQT